MNSQIEDSMVVDEHIDHVSRTCFPSLSGPLCEESSAFMSSTENDAFSGFTENGNGLPSGHSFPVRMRIAWRKRPVLFGCSNSRLGP